MSFFDLSHIMDVPQEGSAGPPVGFLEMVQQSYRQQFRVDSARALDEELRNRWLESLRAAQIADAEATDPFDPYAYRAFAQHVSGQPVDTFDANKPLFGDYDPTARLRGMIDANEKIKQLNDPKIKTFEQILEEVAQMQHETEEETVSMSERGGGFVASLLGAVAGSFTTRDPLNIITAPIGAGRTVATRIASEMGIAAGIVGYTELAEVAPAREIVGLPERNPLFNIAAATVGAGAIRGGIEGVGYGLRRLRSEDIDFDLRDSQLAQMFDTNSEKPSARAGAMILNDAVFLERNNPFGEGRASQERFMAELQQMQRAMNGEPMTAVGRVLPPLPYEYIKKAADFEIVREQAPELYARMEMAQARLTENPAIKSRTDMIEKLKGSSSREFLDEIDYHVNSIGDREYAYDEISALFDILDRAEGPDGSKSLLKEARQRLIDLKYFRPMSEEEIKSTYRSSPGPVWDFQLNKIKYTSDDLVDEWQWPPEAPTILSKKQRKIAHQEYEAAYRAVEAEAIRLREAATRAEASQRRESISILLPTAEGRPFIGPMLQHEYVEELVNRINKFNDTLDEVTVARFSRETFGEGEDAIEVEVWERDGGIDIGLREPVDPNFNFITDEGEMTVAAAMRDLQDDTDLDEAMKVCL